MEIRYFALMCMVAALFSASCSSSGTGGRAYGTVLYGPEYASGFDIVGEKGRSSSVIRVFAPWQGADSTAMELFISRNGERPPAGFSGQVIKGNASSLAVMSSSYIGFLSCLGACGSVAAVSGKHFISSADIRARADMILEAGSDSDPDYEGLLASGTDIVLVYGVTSASPMEKKLKALGIPYVYIGEYLEPDPLGRAEWIVAIAEILGCREKGEEVFSSISHRYDSLRMSVSRILEGGRPAVMLNAPYGDMWFMAPAGSAIAGIIEDAGGRYVYSGDGTNRSVPVSRETAFMLASQADIWLDTGSIRSLDDLCKACPGFSSVRCVRNRMVYNNDARMSSGGGNEFWETSPARPDLVLEDLIRIFHADTVSGPRGPLYYYRRLQ